MVPDRSLVPLALVTVLILTAGCVGNGPSSTDTTPNEAPTPTASESPTSTATEEPIGTSDRPEDLRLNNYGSSDVTMNVSVTYNRTDEMIFSKQMPLAPDEHVDFQLSFPEAGNYTVEATANGTTEEYVWQLEHVPPGHELIVTSEDDEIYFGRSAA